MVKLYFSRFFCHNTAQKFDHNENISCHIVGKTDYQSLNNVATDVTCVLKCVPFPLIVIYYEKRKKEVSCDFISIPIMSYRLCASPFLSFVICSVSLCKHRILIVRYQF